jgi:hypothetical protein
VVHAIDNPSRARQPSSFEFRRHEKNVASIFYGPVLLAAEESGPRTDWRQVTLDATDIGKSIKGDPATLRFSLDGVA